MKVGKSFKSSYQDAQGNFHSRGYFIELESSDLGLAEPSSEKEAKEVEAKLSQEAEALCLIEKAKSGLIHPNQISTQLKPWLPSTSST